ncbi:MAG: VIT1/CCC1 transporter family protein [Candidatus Omnitrophica bacterium]|nr:VIT1/CCC1 transporter family protein [Candidatus Omnitrophota bacterium]
MVANFSDPKDPQSLDRLRAIHTREAIRERLEKGMQRSYLRDFIYGAIDGTVTTFAVVSGVAGAGLASNVVIILGAANLIADGFSMAVGNFLATRTEQELRNKTRKEEEMHIRAIPEGEREEIRQIFAAKGFKGEELEKIVHIITSDAKLWVDTMVQEEFGMAKEDASPVRAAGVTFLAFVAVGMIPLGAFVWNFIFPGSFRGEFLVSAWMTAVAFFLVGAAKSRFVNKSWLLTGVETLAVGATASVLAYAVGLLLRGIHV